MGRHSRVEDPVSRSTGSLNSDSTTSTGSHRAIGKNARRRKVAAWPIACVVLVALLGLGWAGWNWADGVLNTRAEAQASSCPEGDASLDVVVTPSAQQAVEAGAQRWNEAKTVVRGHCVRVQVKALPSEQVLDALTGRSDLAAIGGLPAAWLPESSWWITELTNTRPAMIGSPAESVATARSADYPFLGLSGESIDTVQKHAAQSFRAFLLEPAQQQVFVRQGLTAG